MKPCSKNTRGYIRNNLSSMKVVMCSSIYLWNTISTAPPPPLPRRCLITYNYMNRRIQQKKIARFKIAMAKWKFDYQAHMQDKYEKVFADLQSRYLNEVEGITKMYLLQI